MPPLPDFILGLVDHTWQNQFTTFTSVSPLDYIFPTLIAAVASGEIIIPTIAVTAIDFLDTPNRSTVLVPCPRVAKRDAAKA
jgi:hypothetical protein